MSTISPVDAGTRVAGELVQLLHQGAPAEEFARRLAEVQALPPGHPARTLLVETVHMAMAVRNRLEIQQERERGLLAVIESAQDLTGRLELDGLLAAIVARARNLLRADVAWLSVYDPQRSEFQVLAAEGALAQRTSAMAVHRDRGVAGVVMSTRMPFATSDYLHDTRFAHDPVLDDIFREEGLATLVGVPLVRDGEVIGLLFVADRYQRMHAAHSISILCTLAAHGAVALRNAHDFERARAAREHADRAREELERHLRSIHAAVDAHAQMTSLLARGASLATLCQSVAELLGGCVLVLDEGAQVVGRGCAAGYAGTAGAAYDAHGGHSAALASALRESRETGRSTHAFDVGGEHCRVMPVIGGDDLLGSALLFHTGELEEIAVRTFERSSSVIGIVLLSQHRMEATRSRDASALLRAMVSTRQEDAALLANRAARHGLDLARPLALMLVEIDGAGAGYAARRFRSATPLPQALVDEVDGVLVVLCGATVAPDVRREVSAWARAEPRLAHRGVLSRPMASAAEIPPLYAALRRALQVLARLGAHGRIVGQNELALYSALFETQDRASLQGYLEATLGALLAHDQRRGQALTATLLAYFDANQNARATAQRLGIHVNTVRQRLATVEGLIGPWNQAARALELHMALRLWGLVAGD